MNTQTRMIRSTKAVPEMMSQKDQLQAKIEEYTKLALDFGEREKVFKEQTKEMKSRMDTLKAELTETAKELDVTVLDGENVNLEFTGRNTRFVNATDLFIFFKKMNQSLKFFDYVKVQLGTLEDSLGKSVVEASGLVENEFNKWSGIKIKPKSLS